jgi:hypothetical protein
MSLLRNVVRGLRSLLRKKRIGQELDEELDGFLEMAAEEKIKQAMNRKDALRAVRLERGSLEVTKEVVRSAGWESVLETSWHDLRYGLRQLRKNQGLTAVCVLTLAIGIGATTAIFSVVDSLLLRPLPYPNSHRIVRIWNTFSPRGLTELTASEPEFLEYHQSQTLAHVAGFALGSTTLTGRGDPARLSVSWGTSDFFPVLGTQPVLGRSFSPDEQEPGHDQVVILSHHLWRDRFGSNLAIIGKSVILNGKSCTVIGVMPANFRFPSGDVDLWQPLPIAANSSNLGNHYLNLVGGLKPQVRLEQSNAELKTILTRIEQKYPAYYSGAVGIGVNLVPLREQMVGNVRPRFATFYKDLQEKVRRIPSVRAVAIVNQLPMSDVLANSSFEVEGRQLEAGTNIANTQVISPDYFSVMRIPLIRGRVLDERDLNPAPSTVVVNQSLARKIWPEEDAIGKRLRLKTDAPWLTVVGVVSDIKNEGPNKETKPELYFLYTEKSFGLWADLRSMTLVVRTSSEPQQMASAIRGQLNSLDPDLPIYKLQRLGEIVSASASQTRLPAVLLSVFAGNALLLAAVGVYGVLAYTVAQSRHEIGVRMALGAPRQHILKLFLGHGLKWAALGGSAGLVAAFILVRFMRSMLFEVGPYDPTIFLSVAGVLGIVVLMACYFPASRASSVDPMVALRYE